MSHLWAKPRWQAHGSSFGASKKLEARCWLVSDQQGSIIARVRGDDGRAVYLMHLWPGKGGISLSLRWLHKRPALSKEADRQRMLDGLKDVVGTLTTENLKGFPSFQTSVLADPYIQDRFAIWLRNACEIARRAG